MFESGARSGDEHASDRDEALVVMVCDDTFFMKPTVASKADCRYP